MARVGFYDEVFAADLLSKDSVFYRPASEQRGNNVDSYGMRMILFFLIENAFYRIAWKKGNGNPIIRNWIVV